MKDEVTKGLVEGDSGAPGPARGLNVEQCPCCLPRERRPRFGPLVPRSAYSDRAQWQWRRSSASTRVGFPSLDEPRCIWSRGVLAARAGRDEALRIAPCLNLGASSHTARPPSSAVDSVEGRVDRDRPGEFWGTVEY